MSGGWTSFRTSFRRRGARASTATSRPTICSRSLRAAGIDGTILVQSLDNYDETLHYLDVADQNDFIRAVVGWVPLADPAACARALDALKARKKFVGMRHLIVYEKDPRWLLQPRCRSRCRAPQRGSRSRRSPTPRSRWIGARHRAAHAGPEHRAQPSRPSAAAGEGLGAVGVADGAAAAFANISVKLSVGGDIVWRWTWSTMKSAATDHVMQHFGRAGSWPEQLAGGAAQRQLPEVWRGIEDCCGPVAADRAAVLGGTAERIYASSS